MNHTALYQALHVLLDELERDAADPTLLCDAMLALGTNTAGAPRLDDRVLTALWRSGWRPSEWMGARGCASWTDVGLMLDRLDIELHDDCLPCLRVRVEWKGRNEEDDR